MRNLLEIVQLSANYLESSGIERSKRAAEEVVADVLGLKRLDLFLQHDRILLEEELAKIRAAISRRSRGEPVAYIVGSVSFCGLEFEVNPSVLIPRPETEILVEMIASKLAQSELVNKTLWDLCCGSGCIGLSLKHRFPQLSVSLSDISEKALLMAKRNRQKLLDADVNFYQGDLFVPFQGKKCDFFVCNPPYIKESELPLLSHEVSCWEPKLALISGKTGLEFYQMIARQLRSYLNPGGVGWLELGTGQGNDVKNIFELEGYVCHYDQDWSGHDRFFFIENF